MKVLVHDKEDERKFLTDKVSTAVDRRKYPI